ATAEPSSDCLQHTVSDPAVGESAAPGIAHFGAHGGRLSADWEAQYAHRLYLLETFVDPERFRGTCYLAANWKVLGETTGRGKADLTHRPNRSIKQVLALPLHRRFRERLSESTR